MEVQYIHHDPINNELVTCYLVGGASMPGADPARDRIITEVQTSRGARQKGLASAVMKRVCADADREGVRLYLVVCPDGTPDSLDLDQLIAWYTRLGFEFIFPDDTAMVRHPRKEG